MLMPQQHEYRLGSPLDTGREAKDRELSPGGRAYEAPSPTEEEAPSPSRGRDLLAHLQQGAAPSGIAEGEEKDPGAEGQQGEVEEPRGQQIIGAEHLFEQ
jgi:hypothetical protein